MRSLSSGLVKTKGVGEYQFTLKSLPTEYIVINQLKKDNVSREEWNRIAPHFDKIDYFQLLIEVPGYLQETIRYKVENEDEYAKRVEYLSFGMQQDIGIVDKSGGERACVIYHFERTHGLAPYASVLLGFEKTSGEQERSVVINDHLFHNGPVSFHWSGREEQKLPQLKLI